MKRVIIIIVSIILILALLGGIIACAILFSNDKLIYNAISNNEEALAEHCQKAYDKLTSNSYFDMKFTNPDNPNKKSLLKVYIDKSNYLVATLTVFDNGTQYDYHFERGNQGSVAYYTEGDIKLKNKSISFVDVMQGALSLSEDYLPNIERTAKDLARPFNGEPFEKNRYLAHKSQNNSIFDLTKNLIAVDYQFILNDEEGNYLYTIDIIIDKDYTIRELQIHIDNTVINAEFVDLNNSQMIAKKTPDQDSQYIEVAPW